MRWVAEWIEWAEPIAHGQLALAPREFADLTPGEFMAMARGAKQRADELREVVAWAVTWIINRVGKPKQPVRMDDLLGPEYTLKVAERLRAKLKG